MAIKNLSTLAEMVRMMAFRFGFSIFKLKTLSIRIKLDIKLNILLILNEGVSC